MTHRTAQRLTTALTCCLATAAAVPRAAALSLPVLTGEQRVSTDDCIPPYDPPAPGSWLLRLEDPAAIATAKHADNLREVARGLAEEVVRGRLVDYLPYLVPNRDAQVLALEAIAARDWTATLSLATRHASANQPELARVIFAFLTTCQGQYATAAGHIQKIPAEQRQSSPLAALAALHLDIHAGRYSDALAGLDRLLIEKPWPEAAAELTLTRACVLGLLGRAEESSKDIQAVLESMSHPERIATELGRRLLLAERWEPARAWFIDALGRRADYAPAASGLVLSHLRQGKFADANRAATEWFRPTEPLHTRILAELLHRSGDSERALAELRRLREQRPDDPALLAWEAAILLDRCDLPGALTLLDPFLSGQSTVPFAVLCAYARALDEAGDYARIERILDRLPDRPGEQREQHRLVRAWWVYQQEEYQRALADLEATIEAGHGTAAVHALLGAVNIQLHNRMRSLEAFNAARQLTDEALRITAIEAEAQLEARRLDDAGPLIQQLLDAAPDSGWACLLRARLLDMRGRHAEAIEWCDRASGMGAPERETRLQRVESLLRARDYTRAQADIEFLAEHYPESPAVLVQRAIWRFHQNDEPGADADARAVLQRGRSRERAQAAVLLGVASARTGNVDEAMSLAEQAIRIRANLAEPYLLRGALKLRERNYVAAEADFTRALRLEPNLQEAYDLRGRTLQQKGYYREAIRDFSQAIDLGGPAGDLAQWHLQRALCQIELGARERAQLDLDRAREIAGDLPELHFVRGRLLALQAEWQEAVDEFNQYLALRNDPAAVGLRDACLRQLGDQARAGSAAVAPPPAAGGAAPDTGRDRAGSAGSIAPATTTPEATGSTATATTTPTPTPTTGGGIEPPAAAPAAGGAADEDPIALLLRATREPPPAAAQTTATTAPGPLAPSLTDLRTKAQANPQDIAALLALAQAETLNGTRESALRALADVVAALEIAPSPLSAADRARVWDGVINLTGILQGTPDALRQAGRAVEELPEALDLRGLRAAIALAAGQADTAAADVAFILERDPAHTRARLLEAQLLLNAGQADLAGQKLDELAATSPDSAEVELTRGILQANRGEWETALRSADRALELGANTAQCRLLRARANSNLGRHDEALADARLVAREDPSNLEAALLEISLLAHVGRVDEALAALDQRVKDHPEDWAALHLLCSLALQSPRRAEVIETLLPLGLERFPEKAPFHVLQARILLENNELEKALEAANQAVRKDPALAEAWQVRGRILGAAQSYDQAKRDLAQAVQLDPNMVDAWSDLGAVHLQLKETAEALKHLRRAAELAPAHPLNLYRLGIAYLDGGEPAEAADVFAELRKAQPAWVEGWRQGIIALRQAGRVPQADALAAEARSQFPDRPGF